METKENSNPPAQKPSRSSLITNQRQKIGGALFIIGLILGLGFNFLAVTGDLAGFGFWGDPLDATLYDNTQPALAELTSIRCPIILAPGEDADLRAGFRNPHEEKANILLKVVVSEGDYLHYRELISNLAIDPGNTEYYDWQVSSGDIVERNFILSRVFLLKEDQLSPFPIRTNSCGIIVFNLAGLNGISVVITWFVISMACLVVGVILLTPKGSILQKTQPRIDHGLYALSAFTIFSMIANLLGRWVYGGILLVLSVLFTTILISNILNLEKK